VACFVSVVAMVTSAAPDRAAAATSAVPPAATSSAAGGPNDLSNGEQTLAVEPSDGYRSIVTLLAGAKRSIDMTMYELADPTVQAALVDAHRRGVAVRVLLDGAFGGLSVNRPTATQLLQDGVAVRITPASVIFHQKTVTVDGLTSAVMTGNLTSQYYPTTRDFIVFDKDPEAVSAVESVFDQDWTGSPPTPRPTAGGLVWSPGATRTLLDLINGAQRSLVIENEEMDSTPVESALEAASRRGVSVSVIMTEDAAWTAALARLHLAGVRLAIYPDDADSLCIHAKAMVADGTTAYVGSQNFSTSNLDHNRELGLVTTDQAIVAPLSHILAADVAGGTTSDPGHPQGASPEPISSTVATPLPTSTCLIDPHGSCYRANEFCPSSLREQTIRGVSGSLTCVDRDGWRWESAS
jgi:phosphatidylserine/phosphatidylglycerophosphate/cardiolipin synthase-like enzyme